MKNSIFLFIAFVPVIVFAQKQDYDIYSSVVDYQLKSYRSRIDKIKEIVFAEKVYTEPLKDSALFGMAKDTVPDEDFVHIFYKDIAKRFLTEIDIRKAVAGIMNDVDNQPDIQASKIKINLSNIKIISFKNYDAMKGLGKQKWLSPDPLPHFAFTKVSYYGNFAALYVGLSDEGRVFVLERVNNQWIIIGNMSVWVS